MTLARQLPILPELELEPGDEVASMLARGGLRDSTIKRYLGGARAWWRYCADRGEPAHNASTDTLLRWLDWRVRNSVSPASALRMSISAARFVQRAYCAVHGLEHVPYTPQARVQLDAFARSCTMNRQTQARARPLRLADLVTLLGKVRRGARVRRGLDWQRAVLLAERDAAMLLVGWWGALRADDVARLQWHHIVFTPNGLELHISESKTTHALLALAARPDAPALCPVRALELYRAELGAEPQGHVFGFTTGDHVGRRMKDIFVRCGIPRGYSGHSLRAGFATECASQGVPDRLVQAHGRWRSVQQHSEYVRLGRLWEDTPTSRVHVELELELELEGMPEGDV